VYEAWTDEGSVYTVSVESREYVQPKKTVTYNIGQTHTAVRYGTSGLTVNNIHRTHRAPQEGLEANTDRPSAAT